ncbi:MAG: hypothetical protein AB8B80_15215 [Marinicellaceae bacterium]
MKHILILITLFISMEIFAGTEITYQGVLNQGGSPANGEFDLEFKLWDNPNASGQFAWGIDSIDDVVVENGLFNVILDFGDTFAAVEQEYWMEILVREGDNIGDYTPLAPLQKVTSSLFAIKSDRVPAGSIDSGDIAFNSIVSGNIRDESISSIDILNSTITHFDIQDGTIRSADIQDSTITGADIQTSPIFNGVPSWSCPSDQFAVGTWCIERSPIFNTGGESLTECHNKGMVLCPMEAILTCDSDDLEKDPNLATCGTYTDTTPSCPIIRTSNLAGTSSESFNDMLTYNGCGNIVGTASSSVALNAYCCSIISR